MSEKLSDSEKVHFLTEGIYRVSLSIAFSFTAILLQRKNPRVRIKEIYRLIHGTFWLHWARSNVTTHFAGSEHYSDTFLPQQQTLCSCARLKKNRHKLVLSDLWLTNYDLNASWNTCQNHIVVRRFAFLVNDEQSCLHFSFWKAFSAGCERLPCRPHPHWTRGANKWSQVPFWRLLDALLVACSVDSSVATIWFLHPTPLASRLVWKGGERPFRNKRLREGYCPPAGTTLHLWLSLLNLVSLEEEAAGPEQVQQKLRVGEPITCQPHYRRRLRCMLENNLHLCQRTLQQEPREYICSALCEVFLMLREF